MVDPTCIELFAGAGGASLGLHRAGMRSLLAAEWDEDSCRTHEGANLGPVWHGDVRELDAELNLLDSPLLMWASPPCQAFSSAGTRKGALDDRNGWPWTLDILDLMEKKGVRPTWVICENVPGLTFHHADCTRDEDGDPTKCPGCYWERWIIPEFKKRYASVQTGILDAADFGLPQRRRRVFLVAGPRPFEWPKRTHSLQALVHSKWIEGSYWEDHGIMKPKKGPGTAERKEMGVELMFRGPEEGILPWTTVRDALGLTYPVRHQSTTAKAIQHLPDETAPTVSIKGTIYAERDVQDIPWFNPAYHDPDTMTLRRQRGKGWGERRDHPVDEPSPTVEGGDARCGPRLEMRFYERNSGQRGMTEKSLDEPSPTVQAGGKRDPRLRLETQVQEDSDDPEFIRIMMSDGERHTGAHAHGGAPVPTYDAGDRPSRTLRAGRAPDVWTETDGSGKAIQGTQDAAPDDPSPTIRAGGNVDASGKLGGGAPPYLTEEADEEPPEDDLDVFDMFGDVEEAPEPKPSMGTGYLEEACTRPELIDEPSRAVAATDCKGAGPHPERRMRASDDLLLSTGRRRLTVDECAVLQGFPDDYPFQGNSTSRYRQVGNAVAPPVAEALGRSILAASKDL